MTWRAVGAAYDGRAEEYVEKLGSLDQMAEEDRGSITSWRERVTGRILDAGCGPGHWTAALSYGTSASAASAGVIGIDASAGFLASASDRFPGLGFARGDLAALPLASQSVDGILAWYSLIHAEPAALPAILGEFARVLAPGGSLLLGFFDGPPRTAFDHAVTTAYYWSGAALGDLLVSYGFTVERTATRQDPGPRRRHGELVATLLA